MEKAWKTKGRTPWFRPVEDHREIMGGYRPEIVKRTLDILMNRQSSPIQVFG